MEVKGKNNHVYHVYNWLHVNPRGLLHGPVVFADLGGAVFISRLEIPITHSDFGDGRLYVCSTDRLRPSLNGSRLEACFVNGQ